MSRKLKLFLVLALCVACVFTILAACNDNEEDSVEDVVVPNEDAFADPNQFVPYTTEGDDYFFGSYPQSKVTDETVISALNEGLKALVGYEDADSGETIYLPGGGRSVSLWKNDLAAGEHIYYLDFHYEGNVYRALYKETSAETAEGGNAGEDASGTVQWFVYEPIRWNVIAVKNGGGIEKVTLLSSLVIDYMDFGGGNFADSGVRSRLNGSFLEDAFDAYEQAVIVSEYSINDESTSGVAGTVGTTTYDKISLAARTEAENSSDAFLKKEPSGYAEALGADGDWWLRSTGNDGAMFVDEDGVFNSESYENLNGISPIIEIYLCYEGAHNHAMTSVSELPDCFEGGYKPFEVCPICYSSFGVSRDQCLLSATGHDIEVTFVPSTYENKGYYLTSCAGCGLFYRRDYQDKLSEGDRVDAAGKADENGEYLVLGSYPQTQVTDDALIKELENLGKSFTEKEKYGYEYADIEYGDEKYRAVRITKYLENVDGGRHEINEKLTNQYKNGYESEKTYWFKWEPVRWHIESEKDGNYTLISALILGAADYAGAREALAGLSDDLGLDFVVSESEEEEFDKDKINMPKDSSDYALATGLGNDTWWLGNSYNKEFAWCVNFDGKCTASGGDCVKDKGDKSVGVVLKTTWTKSSEVVAA